LPWSTDCKNEGVNVPKEVSVHKTVFDSGSGSSILDWISIRIQGVDDQILEKNLQLNKKFHIFFYTKLRFTLPIHKRHSSYRRSLQASDLKREHPCPSKHEIS
jgi:hypothetical protein